MVLGAIQTGFDVQPRNVFAWYPPVRKTMLDEPMVLWRFDLGPQRKCCLRSATIHRATSISFSSPTLRGRFLYEAWATSFAQRGARGIAAHPMWKLRPCGRRGSAIAIFDGNVRGFSGGELILHPLGGRGGGSCSYASVIVVAAWYHPSS